jgi:hypothetical protein
MQYRRSQSTVHLSRHRRWACRAVIAVALGAVAAAVSWPAGASASARGPGTPWDPTGVVAFSDTNFGPDSTEYAPFDLQQLAAAYCKGTGDQSRVPSLSAALKIADKLVAADTRGKGLVEFAKTRYGHSESKSIGIAAGEFASGRPVIALTALLRAHHLAPHDAVPLIDAAPLLTQAGKARAALKMLAAAKNLKMPKATPFGVSFTALLENNQGQALLGTHQFSAAVTVLTKAVRASSVLRESRQLLAAAYLCTKNKGKAGKFLLAGTFRETLDLVLGRDTNPAEVLDTRHGKQLELPVYSYPATMQLGASELQLWGNLEGGIDSDTAAMSQQLASDNAALVKAEAKWNPLTKARTSQILQDVNDAPDLVPELATLERNAEQVQQDIANLEAKGTGEAGCLDPTLHAQWLSDVQAYDTEERDAAEAEYNMETAFASNLRNLLAHRVGNDMAKFQSMFNDFLLADAGKALASYDAICYRGDPGSPPDSVSSGKPSTPPSDPCPTSIPHVNFKFGIASLSINCESVSAELSPEGELFFVSGEHNFKKGQNTLFFGAKLDLLIVSAHAGAAITVDAKGQPVDVAVRGTTSVELGGENPVGIGVDGPSGQIGVAGGLSITLPTDPSPESP